MERREAISELKWVKKINQEILNTDAKELDIDCAWIKHWESVIEALDMAISSLETDEAYQLEYEKLTVDAIPRECIDEMIEEVEAQKEYEYKMGNIGIFAGLATSLGYIHKYCDKEQTE